MPPTRATPALPPAPGAARRPTRAAGRRALAGLAVLLGLALGTAPAAGWAAVAQPSASAALPAAADALADPVLLALEFAARAQPMATAARLDSLAASLPEADPRRLFALALRSTVLASHDDLDGAQRVHQQLLAQERSSPLARACAAWAGAAVVARSGSLQRPMRLLTEALATLGDEGAPLLRWHLSGWLAQLKADAGALDDAVRLRQGNITLADALGPDWRRSEARNGLAYALVRAEQADRAAVPHAEALALAKRSGDALALSRSLTTASFLHELSGDIVAERAALDGAIVAARQAGSREYEVLGLANLADHYLQRGDYPTALRLAQQALPLARDLADQNSESVALSNIGLALISMHRLAEGQAALREAMAIDERARALTNLLSSSGEQGRYLERAGYAPQAYAAYRRQRELADEVFRRDNQRAILELQEGFDEQRRQRQLAQLQRDNRLQQADLHNRQLRQRLWAVAVAGGLLLLGVAVLLLRRLRQHNRALAEGNARLRQQSEIDPLTGLANRRLLQQRLAQHSGGTSEQAPFEGALLLIDLDHFKQINDRHGHAAGDAVLVAVAQRLRAALREPDLLVRWGGEEFLVFSPPLPPAALQALAQRLLDTVADSPVALDDGPREAGGTGGAARRLQVTASIGFANFPLAPHKLPLHWGRAIDLVDTALYLAKAHGRNRAYGLAAVPALDEAALLATSRRLEAAWRAGELALTALSGPSAPPEAETAAVAAGPDRRSVVASP